MGNSLFCKNDFYHALVISLKKKKNQHGQLKIAESLWSTAVALNVVIDGNEKPYWDSVMKIPLEKLAFGECYCFLLWETIRKANFKKNFFLF